MVHSFVEQIIQFKALIKLLLFWVFIFQLAGRDLRKGRDHLMWVLLQFISGSIQRNPVSIKKSFYNLFCQFQPTTKK